MQAFNQASSAAMILPNLMTLTRIALVPVFALVYLVTDNYHYIAGLLFAVASLTDWVDGYLARRMQAQTRFGEFLDPVADKLIVSTALVMLVGMHGTIWMTLPGVVIIGREVLVSALREWMAEMNRRGDIAVTWFTKGKTMVQMFAIFILLCNVPGWHSLWTFVGVVFLYIATAMTLWSMALYLRATWTSLRDGFLS